MKILENVIIYKKQYDAEVKNDNFALASLWVDEDTEAVEELLSELVDDNPFAFYDSRHKLTLDTIEKIKQNN